MTARDDYPALAWRAAIARRRDDPSEVCAAARDALDELDSLRAENTQLRAAAWTRESVTAAAQATPWAYLRPGDYLFADDGTAVMSCIDADEEGYVVQLCYLLDEMFPPAGVSAVSQEGPQP